MAGEPGFEPGPTESESAVLPLYYSPKAFQIKEVSRSLTSVIALFLKIFTSKALQQRKMFSILGSIRHKDLIVLVLKRDGYLIVAYSI